MMYYVVYLKQSNQGWQVEKGSYRTLRVKF